MDTMSDVYTNEKFVTKEFIKDEIEKQETIKRLYIGFNNKSKLESLRFFII